MFPKNFKLMISLSIWHSGSPESVSAFSFLLMKELSPLIHRNRCVTLLSGEERFKSTVVCPVLLGLCWLCTIISPATLRCPDPCVRLKLEQCIPLYLKLSITMKSSAISVIVLWHDGPSVSMKSSRAIKQHPAVQYVSVVQILFLILLVLIFLFFIHISFKISEHVYMTLKKPNKTVSPTKTKLLKCVNTLVVLELH